MLLALAWVFVPIYSSSEVSLLRVPSSEPGLWSSLVVVMSRNPWLHSQVGEHSELCLLLVHLTFLSTHKGRAPGMLAQVPV